MFNPWLDLSFKAFQLGLETQSVVALRMMRLASGGARAQTEARRMVSEGCSCCRGSSGSDGSCVGGSSGPRHRRESAQGF